MLTWHYVTRAQYDAAAASDKSADKLFFLSDTKEIYRGTQPFTESVILYTTEPTSKAVGKLYINATTLEGRIWNGSAWTTVIQPVQATVDTADTTKPVSGKAVADYVAEELAKVTASDGLVANVEYVADSNGLKVTMADGTSDTIPMTNVAADLVYDKTTGLLQVKNASGTTIGTGINLDLERFVSEASYDHASGTITLKFNDDQDPLTIDIGDLVDTYTAKSSTTVALTVTGNEFVAEAIVSAADGNQLQKTDGGLFVAATDLSAYSTTSQMEEYVGAQVKAEADRAAAEEAKKANKVSDATAGALAALTADGDLAQAAVTVGGSALAAAPSAYVLATEAAVAAIRTALQTSIDAKMDKVGTGHTDEIIVADAEGNAAASGYKAGGATMANKDAATLATEAGVVAYVEGYAVAQADVVEAVDAAVASTTKVTSEAAVVDALTWKTSV